ncbi:MAG: alanine racemase [Thermodesulfobacteriota bacterium]|nr:alanine racemase [Thermodesulfobacteriota bacterium]
MTNTPLAWAEIDLTALAGNVTRLKNMAGDHCELMAVVKANAYGHGIIEVSRTALKNGASWLGVARIEEAMMLRENGITAPVLIFGYTPAAFCRDLIDRDIIQTVFSYADAAALSHATVGNGNRLRVHLKVDTGMGRLGLNAVSTDISEEIARIAALPGLALEGIYTHFACADALDKTHAFKQLDRFSALLAVLEKKGIHIPLRHAANSAALISMPDTRLDMVRAGLAIYGLYPSAGTDRDAVALRPTMTLKTRIIQLKTVPAGFDVSYGATYTTPAPTTLAVVPMGYADGYNRGLSSKGEMLVKGEQAPVVGRVCMDLTILDVGHIDNINIGDEVVVIGRQGNAAITADEIADALGTINYEVVSAIPDRVPRIFLK